ncbi:hypothetical protein HDV02_001651 [Globomyces sp. JEL0801]|nr:hypothetical protein HDV02_001651 [Globomyces sp. JEL0801]
MLKNNSATRHIYVDILNYVNYFFPLSQRHSDFDIGTARIRRFVKCAQRSNITLSVFIDAVQKSDEASTKWRKRREREVIHGTQGIPQGIESLLGDEFRALGVPVYYSTDVDNDDAMAKFAQHFGGGILSGDNDFFRYENSSFPVYDSFYIRNGRLYLNRWFGVPRKIERIEKRPLLSVVPEVSNKAPRLISVFASGVYKRGTGSPLVKELGNSHFIVRPLRLALYHRLGVQTPIREIFPTWNKEDQKVEWIDEEVLPDNKLDHLLDNPMEAVIHFFPNLNTPVGNNETWDKHLFCVHSIVLELCVMGGHPKSLSELLRAVFTTPKVNSLTGRFSSLSISRRK